MNAAKPNIKNGSNNSVRKKKPDNKIIDWKRINATTDEEIDFSDNPKISPEVFARGILRKNLKPVSRKSQLTLRIDQDVIEFFKSQGRGYQTKINKLLRAYMEAHDNK